MDVLQQKKKQSSNDIIIQKQNTEIIFFLASMFLISQNHFPLNYSIICRRRIPILYTNQKGVGIF